MRRHRLIEARRNNNWTQTDVAEKLNITAGFYGMLEQGSRNPRLPLAFNLERLFKVPAEELFLDLFSTTKADKELNQDEQVTISKAVNQ